MLVRRYVTVIVLLVVGVVLASGLVNLWFTYRDSRDALAALQGEKAAAAATRVGGFIEEMNSQLLSAAGGRVSLRERRDRILGIQFQFPALVELHYIDESGTERVRSTEEAGPEILRRGIDRTSDPLWYEALSRGVYYAPVEFRDGRPFLKFSRQNLGVSIGVVDLNLLADIVRRVKVGETGFAYVVDRDGVLAAHRDESQVRGGRDLSSLSQVADAIALGGRRSGIIARDAAGSRVFTSYQEIRPIGWPVFVQQPLGEAFAPLKAQILRTLILMALALALAVLAGTLLARRMARPLLVLRHGAARVGSGALDERIELSTGDELEDVADEFNRMAAALQESYADLERKVEERTAQLEEANRHKSEFLAQMSHELRTPLNAIIGFSEVLRERMFGDLNERQEQYVTDILDSGRHLLSLINDVLDLAKVEAGRMELETAGVDLPALLEGAVAMLRERAGHQGLTLGLELGDGVGTIDADERKLKQVLFNLLSNAIKFTPSGGRVDVSARVQGDLVELRVADTGVGIAPEHREAVFEEFAQGPPAATATEGTGLGLPLARRFVELHGGRMWLDSEVGVGTTIAFTLPRRPARVGESGRWTGDRPRALLVEDDDRTVDLLTIYLEGAGYDVVSVADGQEGFARARAEAPDVIVLDVLLPGMDGWDVLSALKADAALSEVPVVVVSMLDERGKGFALGAADYLVKPVGRQDLVSAIVRAVGRPERVLVVDDDPMALELVRAILVSEGIEVELAGGGAEGIAMASADPPDLVILDLAMPELDGFAVLDALRADPATRAVPVLVLTAASLTAEEKAGLNAQMAHLAGKAEFDRASFVELVQSCCRTRTG